MSENTVRPDTSTSNSTGPSGVTQTEDAAGPRRRHETLAFVLLAFVLFPVLSIVLVGGFGFAVWMQHLLIGPPVH